MYFIMSYHATATATGNDGDTLLCMDPSSSHAHITGTRTSVHCSNTPSARLCYHCYNLFPLIMSLPISIN